VGAAIWELVVAATKYVSAGDVVGREEELELLRGFLADTAAGPLALLLEGEPGIGKTTLWAAAVADARERSYRVLACRPAGAEVQLSFAALSDLLADVLEETLPELPTPQRRALEVALLLEEARGPPPDQRAIALAFLGVLRLLARSDPILIAVDDAQWLDTPTAAVLAFALRRLGSEPIALLAAVRREEGRVALLELERAVPEGRLRRLAVGPVSVGALQRLLRLRLGAALSRPTLLRLHEASGGNPFYALELARALERQGSELEPGRPLPIPENLHDLVQERLAELSGQVQNVLLVVAALASPTVPLVRASAGSQGRPVAGLAAAEAAGVIELEGERIRFSHPLLGSTLYSRAEPVRRRRLHRRLARVVSDPEERARHLALAASGADEGVARALDAAARHASARGAPPAAAELAELAIEFTPEERDGDRRRRTLEASDYHYAAGALIRAHSILEALLGELPRGGVRADVLLRLARTSEEQETAAELCERALREAEGDDRLLSRVHAALGGCWPVRGGSRHALAHARSSLEHAELVGDRRLTVAALSRLALYEIWAAQSTPGQLERAVDLEQPDDELEGYESPSTTLALRLFYQGRLDEARALLERVLTETAARGDEPAGAELRFRLADVEWRAGAWAKAAEHAAAAHEVAEQIGLEHVGPSSLYRKALVDAHRGRIDEARAAAEEAVALSEAVQHTSVRAMILGVLGFLELSLGDALAADRHLRPVLTWLDAGEMALASFPASPYAVEALIEVGELEKARKLLAQFEREGRELESPWVLALAARLRGLLEAAAGDLPGALVSLERALAEQEGQGWPFERARTLLALGQTQRRAKQKRAARESLQAALATFEELDASLWAEKARADLRRLGGRPRGPGELTPTEERVAALVGEGRTNREVSAALYVTERTVEGHLTRIYAKLGVRSRAELARRLRGDAS
jgi:DNA-binding CsgD family transcriptional regulator/DNA polymerase III delta prime subunit